MSAIAFQAFDIRNASERRPGAAPRQWSWVGGIALVMCTFWIIVQGYRVITGQSRTPMMALVGDSLRAVLIIGLATSMAVGSSQLYFTLSDGMSTTITKMVTGSDQSAFQSIDNNLAVMQGSMALVDSLDTGGNDAAQADKDRDKWFTGIGVAGPGLIAGCMLLLNKIALALFIGFGPLFILTLLFPQTKPFFSKWLFYGMGTLFSLGVLSVMVSIAMKMVAAVSAAFAANYLASMATGTTTDGINSMSMQQGGLGLILTTLIISAPPWPRRSSRAPWARSPRILPSAISVRAAADNSRRPACRPVRCPARCPRRPILADWAVPLVTSKPIPSQIEHHHLPVQPMSKFHKDNRHHRHREVNNHEVYCHIRRVSGLSIRAAGVVAMLNGC